MRHSYKDILGLELAGSNEVAGGRFEAFKFGSSLLKLD
jgi:hypothetical protein